MATPPKRGRGRPPLTEAEKKKREKRAQKAKEEAAAKREKEREKKKQQMLNKRKSIRSQVSKKVKEQQELAITRSKIHYKLLLHGTILQSSNSFLFHTPDVCFRPNGRNVAKGPKHRKCDGLDGLFFEPG